MMAVVHNGMEKESVSTFIVINGHGSKIISTFRSLSIPLEANYAGQRRGPTKIPTETVAVVSLRCATPLKIANVMEAVDHSALTKAAWHKEDCVSICWMQPLMAGIRIQGGKWIWTKGWMMTCVIANLMRRTVVTATNGYPLPNLPLKTLLPCTISNVMAISTWLDCLFWILTSLINCYSF